MSARNYNSTDTSHTDAADVPLFGDQQPRVSIFVGVFKHDWNTVRSGLCSRL